MPSSVVEKTDAKNIFERDQKVIAHLPLEVVKEALAVQVRRNDEHRNGLLGWEEGEADECYPKRTNPPTLASVFTHLAG